MRTELYKISEPGSRERLQKLVQYWAQATVAEAGVDDEDLAILVDSILKHFNRTE